jgi:hypothetical protein
MFMKAAKLGQLTQSSAFIVKDVPVQQLQKAKSRIDSA